MMTAIAVVAANAFLVNQLILTNDIRHEDWDFQNAWIFFYVIAVPANVLIISMGFAYGLNDTLVAALVVAAIIARHRGLVLVAGASLGLAALLKYYPVFLIPLFALENWRFRPRLVVGAAAVFLVGFAAAVWIWGDAFLVSFDNNVARGPKLFSILAALKSHQSLFGGAEIVDSNQNQRRSCCIGQWAEHLDRVDLEAPLDRSCGHGFMDSLPHLQGRPSAVLHTVAVPGCRVAVGWDEVEPTVGRSLCPIHPIRFGIPVRLSLRYRSIPRDPRCGQKGRWSRGVLLGSVLYELLFCIFQASSGVVHRSRVDAHQPTECQHKPRWAWRQRLSVASGSAGHDRNRHTRGCRWLRVVTAWPNLSGRTRCPDRADPRSRRYRARHRDLGIDRCAVDPRYGRVS